MKNRLVKWLLLKEILLENISWWIGGLLVVLVLLATATVTQRLHWGEALQAADATYADDAPLACLQGAAQGPRVGAVGRTLMRTTGGIPWRVVTPRNYDARRAHPLLLVYAPAGLGFGLSERFAGLTRAATASGFVIVYVGSAPLSRRSIDELATVPAAVAAHWCIDPTQVYATGHSNGGTVAQALAVLPKHQGIVQAIVTSGAGWQAEDFAASACPAPTPVLILHGADDDHFPGFGRDAARWWSNCNACDTDNNIDTPTDAPTQDGDRCLHYTGCTAETVYCEPEFSHWRWAGTPEQIMDFLARQADPAPARPGAVWMF